MLQSGSDCPLVYAVKERNNFSMLLVLESGCCKYSKAPCEKTNLGAMLEILFACGSRAQ